MPDRQSTWHNDESFRLLVDGVKDYAIFLLSPDGIVESWNAGAEQIKGYRRHEIVGQHFSVFYPQDKVAQGWPEFELHKARTEGRIEDEGWRVRKDGTLFWANVVITALFDAQGVLRGYGKVTRDLTERRRHEEELRTSEERFRLLLQNVRDYAIFMLDTEGFIVSWNSGAESIKQYSAAEVIGRHFSLFYPRADVDKDKPRQELDVALRHGRFEEEGWRVRKDGTLFWANVVLTPIHDAEGRHIGFAKATRDMSERKRLEELEHSSHRMNEFLAMLGHELRNPLAPMRNAVTVMQMEPLENMSLLRSVNVLDRQLRHVTRLVDDLLDVGRISTGKITLQKESVLLSSAIDRAIELATAQIRSRGHEFSSELPAEPIWLDGDETRLAQVFHNLLDNAAKYTPRGGRITLRVERLERSVTISVTDNGEGIAAEHLSDIFNLFVQVGQSMSQRGESGLGLGLTLVRSVVEMHGGSVEAFSAGLGQGSCMLVQLPLPQQALPPAPAARSIPVPIRPQHVLVVDDNVDAADSLVLLLQMLGFDTDVAYSGEQALQLMDKRPASVVLLDIGLPGLSGYEVATRLRATQGQRKLKLIALTGYGQSADRQRALDAGFDLHLVKPADPDALRLALAL